MPSYDSYSDLRLDVLDRAEEETGENQSDFYSLVARALDRAYHGLLNRRPWLFSRAPVPLVLQLEAPITTTITWTQDAYAATLGTSQAKNLTGWEATVENITYRVPRHGGRHLPGQAPGLEPRRCRDHFVPRRVRSGRDPGNADRAHPGRGRSRQREHRGP